IHCQCPEAIRIGGGRAKSAVITPGADACWGETGTVSSGFEQGKGAKGQGSVGGVGGGGISGPIIRKGGSGARHNDRSPTIRDNRRIEQVQVGIADNSSFEDSGAVGVELEPLNGIAGTHLGGVDGIEEIGYPINAGAEPRIATIEVMPAAGLYRVRGD